MSVIAWDGSALAADRMGNASGMRQLTTKVVRTRSGHVLAWAGVQEIGLMRAAWYQSGAEPKHWPTQHDGELTHLILLRDGQIFVFENLPVPQPLEEAFCAWGSGRDYAMGAMAAGASAAKAVQIASRYEVDCGLGVVVYGADGRRRRSPA